MEFNKWVPKGWGGEYWIANGPEYCGKILYVLAGRQCSWHRHCVKTETFHCASGKVELIYHPDSDDESEAHVITLRPGDTFHIPVGMRHRFYGLENSQIIEISTQHFEDDSIRISLGDQL